MITQSELDQFNGTEHHYRHWTGMLYTDGVKFLADKAKAYWLLDIVASYQHQKKVRNEEFQVWKLVKTGSEAIVILEDGNDNRILSQKIEYTDFPLESVSLWLQNGVLILPSEY